MELLMTYLLKGKLVDGGIPAMRKPLPDCCNRVPCRCAIDAYPSTHKHNKTELLTLCLSG
jgi:hypothetical protein